MEGSSASNKPAAAAVLSAVVPGRVKVFLFDPRILAPNLQILHPPPLARRLDGLGFAA